MRIFFGVVFLIFVVPKIIISIFTIPKFVLRFSQLTYVSIIITHLRFFILPVTLDGGKPLLHVISCCLL